MSFEDPLVTGVIFLFIGIPLLITGIILLLVGISLFLTAIILCFSQDPIQLWTWLLLSLKSLRILASKINTTPLSVDEVL